jgi:hypothetical protein
LNAKNTSKIIQSEYEELYTGPEFILEVRYGQVLATIFATLTFASGMPSLYALNFAILFVQYWIDKWLLFSYYKRTPQFTHHLSKSVVDLLPYAIVIHLMFAFMTFSYPYFLRSLRVKKWFGNKTQYFNADRLSQVHVIVLMSYAALNIIIFLFEDFCVSNWSACCNSCNIKCKVCCAKCNGKEFDELDFETAGFVLSDDVLLEVDFNRLYKMYVPALKDI